MKKRGNTLLLLCGPAITVVGVDLLSRDFLRGLMIILAAVFLTVLGGYYQWIDPKNRSKLWLVFPGLFTAVGYLPLAFLGERKPIYDRISQGFEVHKSAGSWDKFTLEAANTTKYYLELSRNYHDRFKDEVSLLASAGLLEAQDYIEKTISTAQIINIAKRSVEAGGNALADFIINLEVELFRNYVPEFDVSEIKEACFEKKRDIEYTVQKMLGEYARETEFASATSDFMESYKFQRFREELGISELEEDILIS